MKYGVVKSGGLITAVALFTRAWIEICFRLCDKLTGAEGRPLHEGVD